MFSKEILKCHSPVYDEKIFRPKKMLLIKNLYDIDFEFPKKKTHIEKRK